jgi:ligand-binding sensor domain-containing protein
VLDLLPVGNDLLAATEGGVLHWNLAEGTYVKHNAEDAFADNWVMAIAVDGEGVLWFGTFGSGVSRFDPLTEGEAWTTYTEEDGLAGNRVYTIAVDGEGALWFGTHGGVSRFDPLATGEAWTTYTEEDGLVDNSVFAIAVDGEGALWFGTHGGGVSRFQPD